MLPARRGLPRDGDGCARRTPHLHRQPGARRPHQVAPAEAGTDRHRRRGTDIGGRRTVTPAERGGRRADGRPAPADADRTQGRAGRHRPCPARTLTPRRNLMSDYGPLPVLAVVGRPNVGKSTLVNRILGRREAVVQDVPGVTRDRVAYDAQWAGRRFTVVDSGGWERDARGRAAVIAGQAE